MKKYTQQEFVNLASNKHNNKYDYSHTIYKNGTSQIIILCPHHGQFLQKAFKHLQGQGCKLCSHNNTIENSIIFKQKSKKLHHNKYDYSMVEYINARTYVKIICSEHGIFLQTPDSHIHNHGCPKCMPMTISMKKKSTIDEFILSAKNIHGIFYDYSLVNYQSSRKKINIICPKHGQFSQTPDTHLKGCGCPSCVNIISKVETLWLDLLNLPNDKNHRQVSIKIKNKLFKVDGFDPKTNTVYEFYGDYWHGHPTKYDPTKYNLVSKKKFGELYKNTLNKEQQLKNAGYNIISIWETDFKNRLKLIN